MPDIVLDLETVAGDSASFEYFRHDFRVLSIAVSYRDPVNGSILSEYWDTPEAIERCLIKYSDPSYRIIAHNISFEAGVISRCYPGIKLNWYCDTMRMAQLYDAGGEEFGEPTLSFEQQIAMDLGELSPDEVKKLAAGTKGLSLEAIAKRLLPDQSSHDHKAVAHTWLKQHHGITKQYGQHLHLLPPAILEQYNIADTTVTLQIYEHLIAWAESVKFNWQQDWAFYFMRARYISQAYIDGIAIDRDALYKYILDIEAELQEISDVFLTELAEPLKLVEELRFAKVRDWATDMEIKTDLSRFKRWVAVINGKKDKEWRVFNMGSSLQLAQLFMDVLKIEPRFFTPKESPSFKTSHLNQWGRGGLLLAKRKKRMLVLQQAINTYLASEYDGRVHCQVRSAGTRSNRVAGGRG